MAEIRYLLYTSSMKWEHISAYIASDSYNLLSGAAPFPFGIFLSTPSASIDCWL